MLKFFPLPSYSKTLLLLAFPFYCQEHEVFLLHTISFFLCTCALVKLRMLDSLPSKACFEWSENENLFRVVFSSYLSDMSQPFLEFSGLFYYSVIKILRELCLSPADFPLTRQQDI